MSKKGASDFLNRFRRGSLSRRDKNSPKTKSLPVAAQNYLLLHPSEQNKKNEEDPHKVGILDNLLQKISLYLSDEDIDAVIRGYQFADEAHAGQMRDSGLPYITHPVAVCEICAEWKLDVNALLAALLHDTIEDQDVSKQEIEDLFNTDVAELVDGLTKLDKLQFTSKAEQQAESFRKMLLAMSKDVRVILVKLADRLHNMRTLGGVTPDKGRRVARETLEIYAPIADRLGLNTLVREFHDLCLSAAHPFRYRVLQKATKAAKGNRREVLTKILDNVISTLTAQGIEAEISGREKSLYSIHRKMVEQKKTFAEVLDLHGFRVIVNTLPECYLTLGVLHQLYRPVPGKFKDYVAIPKINGYQSLHTTLVGPHGSAVEFQIRTRDMHNMAEKGLVSHWIYKSKGADLNEVQQQTHRWLQSLLDIQSQTHDSAEFLDYVKVDLFPDAVFVLTPRGKIVSLPRGATPVDFAYAIHTDIGNHIVSAEVNGEEVAINTPLHSGQTVKVITDENASPKTSWMEFVRTGRARSEIRNYLRRSNSNDSIKFGEKLLHQAMAALGIQVPDDENPIWYKLAISAGAKNIDEVFLDIGLGTRLAQVVARRFLIDNPLLATTAAVLDEMSTAYRSTILIQGKEGQSVQLATCCTPIPGDQIVAVLRPGYGIVVHTNDCPTALRLKDKEPERWVKVAWDEDPSKHLSTRIEITLDNEKGALGALMIKIAEADSNIINITTKDGGMNISKVQATIQVEDRDHLAKVFRSIRTIRAIRRITRIKNQ